MFVREKKLERVLEFLRNFLLKLEFYECFVCNLGLISLISHTPVGGLPLFLALRPSARVDLNKSRRPP
jgi:hypothetical protein